MRLRLILFWHARSRCQCSFSSHMDHLFCFGGWNRAIMLSVQHCSGMKRFPIVALLPLLPGAIQTAFAIQPPTGVVSCAGDQTIVLHWDKSTDPSLGGYRVYRSTAGSGGPFTLVTATLLTSPGYCDLS